MAAPLIVRLVMDAAGYLKTVDTAVASNTKLADSSLAVGDAIGLSAEKQVAASLKATRALETQIAGQRALAAETTKSAEVRNRANLLADRGQARLNASLGLATAAAASHSTAVKTGERDLGKFTRGALAGSGAASSLGRSLAFASTGFIAIAGTSTIVASSIKAAIDLEKTQRQVERQLQTTGKSWDQYGAQIDAADLKLSHVSGFTNQELLQSFTTLFRVTGNVSKSLTLNSLAADVARGRNISLTAASNALAKAQAGSFSALRRLNIVIPQGSTKLQALAFVTEKYAGQAAAGATVSDKFHAALVNAQEIIGTALLPTFTRLTTEIGDWLSKMSESGRLQRDVNDVVTVAGVAFHTLGDIIGLVDKVTGSFKRTFVAVLALFAIPKIVAFGDALLVVAGNWGLVGKAAVTAAAEQEAALGATGAGAAAGGGVLSGGLIGGLIGSRLIPAAIRGRLAARSAAGVIGGFGTADAAVGLSATGVGALAVAAVLATGALDDLAKKANKAAGGPGAISQGIDIVAGVLSGGLVGNPRFGLLGQALHGFPGFGGPNLQQPPPYYLAHLNQSGGVPPFLQLPGSLGRSVANPAGAGPFGGATPIAIYTQYTQTITEALAVARAQLTKTTRDDVAAAKAIIARIKREIDHGHLEGVGLIQALNDEAAQQGVLDSARQKAAQQAAAIAAAKRAAASTYTTPIDLQLAEARAQLTKSTADDIAAEKKILAAAKAAVSSGKKNKQGQLAALQIELQAQQALAALQQQNSTTFTQSLRLQLALAKAQATGADTTPILKREKAALERALKAAKGNIQKQIDIYNQIAAINQQMQSSITNAYGDYKKASVKAETAGLGLTAAQRRELEQRLSRRGPGGTEPSSGVGAGGFIIGPDGRPIHRHRRPRYGRDGGGADGGPRTLQASFDIKVFLDSKPIAAKTTVHQQSYRRGNPSSRRGPNAGAAHA